MYIDELTALASYPQAFRWFFNTCKKNCKALVCNGYVFATISAAVWTVWQHTLTYIPMQLIATITYLMHNQLIGPYCMNFKVHVYFSGACWKTWVQDYTTLQLNWGYTDTKTRHYGPKCVHCEFMRVLPYKTTLPLFECYVSKYWRVALCKGLPHYNI